MGCALPLAKRGPPDRPSAPRPPQMRSCTLACTSTSWARTQPSSAPWGSRRPCARISTTPGGSTVSAVVGAFSGPVSGQGGGPVSVGVVLSRAWVVWGRRRRRPADPSPPADPSFIHAELIPDSAEHNDDKLYFFFRERSAEAPQSPAMHARIGRICLVGAARGCPRRPSARLRPTLPGPGGGGQGEWTDGPRPPPWPPRTMTAATAAWSTSGARS